MSEGLYFQRYSWDISVWTSALDCNNYFKVTGARIVPYKITKYQCTEAFKSIVRVSIKVSVDFGQKFHLPSHTGHQFVTFRNHMMLWQNSISACCDRQQCCTYYSCPYNFSLWSTFLLPWFIQYTLLICRAIVFTLLSLKQYSIKFLGNALVISFCSNDKAFECYCRDELISTYEWPQYQT